MDTSKFKALLDDRHQWPCEYTFKFVVPADKEDELAAFFEASETIKKNSKTGKFISFTIVRLMNSSDEVIEVYTKVSEVEGVVSL